MAGFTLCGQKSELVLITLSKNFEALEFARSLDIRSRSILSPIRPGIAAVSRSCASGVRDSEIVNISVNTPYPGTETWHKEARHVTTRDYRLYDIQHTVLPTQLPLPEFYHELVQTQQILNRKHLGWNALKPTARIAAGLYSEVRPIS